MENSNKLPLVLRLLYADTEEAVQSIIDGDAAMRDDRNWYPVDGRDTNFNVISNQSSDGAKAATELMTNMVDAMLTKRCLESGIDPKSSAAPSTMYRAVDKFVTQLNGGKIFNADDPWLKSYAAKNLVIGVTGSPSGTVRPCYTFCDNGEGQRPDNFVRTFLSLSAKNKSQIPFVQGKYNMGSSGVLNFCGRHWFKLIVSRRYDKSAPWGWTLIRKRTPASGMPYAEYFAIDGVVGIAGDDPICPFKTRDGKVFAEFSLTTGTVIKLYEYHVKQGHSFRVTREAFNENLVETILPFRIMDFRQTPSASRGGLRARGIDERRICGMEFLLGKQHADEDTDEPDIESENREIIGIGKEDIPSLGTVFVSAIVLKKKSAKTGWIKNSNYRIFHHVNGQVQFKQTRGFLTQCRLPALKDRVVIFVDASKLTDSAHQSVWKGDRQSIFDNNPGEEYRDAVKAIIRNSSVLKELNYRIAREELDAASTDSSRKLVAELVARDKNLALLLDGKVPDVPMPLPHPSPEPSPRTDLKHSPSYVKFKTGQREISLPINRTRPIPCDTDARDDFLTRSDNRGTHIFSNDAVAEKFRCKTVLKNGEFVLFMNPVSVQVGDEFRFSIGLVDDAMHQPVYTEELVITITLPAQKPDSPPPPPPPLDTSPRRGGLPPYVLLTSDGRDLPDGKSQKWEETNYADFGAQDGGYVKDVGEGHVYYINYDNAWFKNYLQSQKREDQAAASKKYVLGMRILMLGLENALTAASDKMKDIEDEFRRLAARGAAAVVMTVCDQLPHHLDLFKDEEGGDEEE